jgi:hypothetical protein
MPRLNSAAELFKRINRLELIRPVTPTVKTTITETIEADETSFTVASTTGFAIGNPVIIASDGSTEFNELTDVTGPVTTLYKAARAGSTGADLYKAEKVFLGEVSEAGFSINPSQDTQDIFGAYSDTALVSIPGQLNLSVSFELLGHNIENFLLWMGQTETVQGTGIPTDPYQGIVGGGTGSLSGIYGIRASFTRANGSVGHFDCAGMTITPSGSKAMGRTAAGGFPCSGKITHITQRIWVP